MGVGEAISKRLERFPVWKRLGETRFVLAAALTPLIAVSGGLLWIVLDKSPLGGDQSQYGRATLELFSSLRDSPIAGLHHMLTVFPTKPNGIIWIGQLFVPFAYIFGSVDAALRLSLVVMQAATLILVYRAVREASPGAIAPALAACLLVGAAPQFVTFGHRYMAETQQILSVAWFLFILTCSPRWNRWLVVAQLVAAGSFAVSAKANQPLLCFWPGLVSLYIAFRKRPAQAAPRPHRATLFTLSLGIPAALITTVWYWHNMTTVRQHLLFSAYGPAIGGYWGRADTFAHTLAYWTGTMLDAFFLPGVCYVWLLVVGAGVIHYLLTSRRETNMLSLCALVAAAQLVTVLAAFSVTAARAPRYFLPVLPYVGVLVAWSVTMIRRQVVTALALAVLLGQIVLVHAQSLGLISTQSRWISPVERSGRDRRVLESIVDRTCQASASGPVLNVLAVDLSTPALRGDWLAPEPANYVVAKRSWRHSASPPCRYDYIGDSFFGSPLDEAWVSMISKDVRYVIVADPAVYPPGELAYNIALSRENLPILVARLRGSPLFEMEQRLAEDRGIMIFRRIHTGPS